jgi:hypothetical protein
MLSVSNSPLVYSASSPQGNARSLRSPSLKRRDGGRFSVVNAWQPPQMLLSPPFSKEEVPDDERARNDLAEFQQTASIDVHFEAQMAQNARRY